VALTQAAYLKAVGAFEPPSYTWTFAKYRYAAGGVVAFGGLDAAAPLLAASGRFSTNTALITAPSVSAPSGSLVIGAFGSDGTGGVTPPAGMIESFDIATKAGTGAARSSAADLVTTVEGATGAKAARAPVTHRSTIGQLEP
jgi:hypothetical protein